MTTGTRATAVVTTDGRTPRPDAASNPEPGALDRVAPGSAVVRAAAGPTADPRSRPAHARRTANPMYDRPSDLTRPKSSLRLSSP